MATRDHGACRAPDTAGLEHTTVLDLILARVRLRARRRAAWLEHLWGSDKTALADRSLAMALDDRDTPAAEAMWYASAKEIQDCNTQLARVEHALEGNSGIRLRQLRDLFRLTTPELDLLQTCLAVMLEPCFRPDIRLPSALPGTALRH